MNLNPVSALFQFIVLTDRFTRQLAPFTYRNEAGGKMVGHSATDNEAPGLDSCYSFNILSDKRLAKVAYHFLKPEGVTEERGNVSKLDSRLRVIRDGTDKGFQRHGDLPFTCCGEMGCRLCTCPVREAGLFR